MDVLVPSNMLQISVGSEHTPTTHTMQMSLSCRMEIKKVNLFFPYPILLPKLLKKARRSSGEIVGDGIVSGRWRWRKEKPSFCGLQVHLP